MLICLEAVLPEPPLDCFLRRNRPNACRGFRTAGRISASLWATPPFRVTQAAKAVQERQIIRFQF